MEDWQVKKEFQRRDAELKKAHLDDSRDVCLTAEPSFYESCLLQLEKHRTFIA